jgi:hypothetical protein
MAPCFHSIHNWALTHTTVGTVVPEILCWAGCADDAGFCESVSVKQNNASCRCVVNAFRVAETVCMDSIGKRIAVDAFWFTCERFVVTKKRMTGVARCYAPS